MKKNDLASIKKFRLAAAERISKQISVLVCWLIAGLVCGCADAGQKAAQEYLVQVNDRGITVEAFQRQMDRMNSDYTDSTDKPPVEDAALHRHLLNQCIEKLVLLERAEELGLKVTDAETSRSVEEIKKDYPDNTFQSVLLEQAVIYSQWEEELKTRILMEKVITKDLEPLVVLTQADISRYYEEHFISNANGAGEQDESLNEALFKLARNKKKEEVYRTWISALQNRYQIKVNSKAWEKINQHP